MVRGTARRPALLVACLLAAPAAAEPPSLSPSGLTVVEIKDAPRLADIASRLQADLLHLGFAGRVASCGHAVHLAASHGDDSFGAVCSVEHGGRRRDLLMCDDRLVGHFALAVTFPVSSAEVIGFTDANCTGG